MGDVSNKTVNVTIYDESSNQLGNITNPLIVKEHNATTSTLTTVNASITSVTILLANTARERAVVTNNSSSILYIAEGATASATAYTYKLYTDDTLIVDDYTGVLSGIWVTATGTAQVTEAV